MSTEDTCTQEKKLPLGFSASSLNRGSQRPQEEPEFPMPKRPVPRGRPPAITPPPPTPTWVWDEEWLSVSRLISEEQGPPVLVTKARIMWDFSPDDNTVWAAVEISALSHPKIHLQLHNTHISLGTYKLVRLHNKLEVNQDYFLERVAKAKRYLQQWVESRTFLLSLKLYSRARFLTIYSVLHFNGAAALFYPLEQYFSAVLEIAVGVRRTMVGDRGPNLHVSVRPGVWIVPVQDAQPLLR